VFRVGKGKYGICRFLARGPSLERFDPSCVNDTVRGEVVLGFDITYRCGVSDIERDWDIWNNDGVKSVFDLRWDVEAGK
jgi:hypothetical protein